MSTGVGLSATQIIVILIALALLLCSAFVSGSEIAFFSLTDTQVDDLDPERRRDRSLRRLIDNPDRLLATILIGNNLVNVAIVVLLNYALGPVFESLGQVGSFIVQTILLTFLVLLFGEILPKLYANTHNLRWARTATPVVSGMMRCFYPLSAVLVRSTGLVNRMVTKRHESLTTDSLTQALELTDVTTPDQKEMLEGILRFGDTTAAEIMTSRVDITDIDVESSFPEVLKVVTDTGFARIPAFRDSCDNIVGVLYSRDLLPYIGPDKTPPDDWTRLLRPAYFVPESRMIDDLLQDFRQRRLHMAIVIDEYGGTSGVVTLEDVLEEIVGDINDEYDDDDTTYKRMADNTYVFEGKTLLTDFFRITDQDEELYSPVSDDSETLAGMLLAIKGDFPKEKESLVYGRCRFLVLDVDHHRISRVRVKVMDQIQTS